MNWKNLLREMSGELTLQQIADRCGFASRGHVHDVLAGNQKSVSFDLGTRICAEHARIVRNAKRRAK